MQKNKKTGGGRGNSFLALLCVILVATLAATAVASFAAVNRINKGAALLEEAKDAYDNAAAYAETARTAFLASESNYNAANEAFLAASDTLDEARIKYAASETTSDEAAEAYEEARDAYNGAQTRLQQAEAAVSEARRLYLEAVALFEEEGGSPIVNLEPAAQEIYTKTVDAAVEIRAYDADGTYFALGSGFIISEDGKIATNYHVIDGAFSIKVLLNDGETYDVTEVLGYDIDVDIAVVKIDKDDCANLSFSERLPVVGDTVYAIGSNLGLTRTFTKGVVAYVDRELEDFPSVSGYIHYVGITHSGNSGCAILDAEGSVIGIHQLGDSETGDNGLAIPVSYLEELSLDKHETPKQTALNNAADITDYLGYTVYGGKATVNYIAYNIPEYIIKVPAVIDGYPVKRIDWGANEYSLYYAIHIVFEEGIEEIGADVLYGANYLLTVTLPSTIKSIDPSAFNYCTSLYQIYFESNAYYSLSDGVLYDHAKTYLYKYPLVKSNEESDLYTSTYDVSDGVQTIGAFAFFGAGLTSVTFPSTLKTVEDMAFAYSSLESLTLPASLEYAGAGAFSDIYGLKTLMIPASVLSLGKVYDSENTRYKGTFYNSYNITSLTFEAGSALTDLCDGVFEGLSRITSVTLPSSLITTSKFLFYRCYLLTSVDLSGTALQKTGNYDFYNCYDLSNVALPAGLKTISYSSFSGCMALLSVTLPAGLEEIGNSAFFNSGLTSITLENVKTIGTEAFAYNADLVSVTLNAGLEKIGAYAFAVSTSLPSINIPEGVKRVEEGLFYGCTALNSVTLPATLLQIKQAAFTGCEALLSITVKSPYAPSIEPSVFEEQEDNLSIYYMGEYQSYFTDSAWRIYLDLLILIH